MLGGGISRHRTPYTMSLRRWQSLVILRSVLRGLARNMPGLLGLQVGWQNGCQLGSLHSTLQCILYVLLCGTAQSLHTNCQVIWCFGQPVYLQKFICQMQSKHTGVCCCCCALLGLNPQWLRQELCRDAVHTAGQWKGEMGGAAVIQV